MGNFKDVAVIDVLVNPGDAVEVEGPLVTLETEKATMDVPSTVAGIIEKILATKGGTVSPGDVVATVRVEEAAGAAPGAAAPAAPAATPAPAAKPAAAPAPAVPFAGCPRPPRHPRPLRLRPARSSPRSTRVVSPRPMPAPRCDASHASSVWTWR